MLRKIKHAITERTCPKCGSKELEETIPDHGIFAKYRCKTCGYQFKVMLPRIGDL